MEEPEAGSSRSRSASGLSAGSGSSSGLAAGSGSSSPRSPLIVVSGSGKLKNYVGFAVKHLVEAGGAVRVHGEGKTVTKAISCAEIIKQQVKVRRLSGHAVSLGPDFDALTATLIHATIALVFHVQGLHQQNRVFYSKFVLPQEALDC